MTLQLKTAHVDAADVIRIILQFLKEANLKRSLYCLQEETSVALQSVDSLEAFQSDIVKGKWSSVISTMGSMYLPEDVLQLAYEHIVCEFIESQDKVGAQTILQETSALQSLKVENPSRYHRLETLISRMGAGDTVLRTTELYPGSSREKRRMAIWKALSRHVQQAPASRLVTLLGMALKWKNAQGLLPECEKFDLFRGVGVSTSKEGSEEPRVTRIARTIKFGRKSPPQCLCFSLNGRYLTTGSADGLIEIWDWTTGEISTDFDYQNKECFLAHDDAVMAMVYSPDFSLLITGSSKGDVKIWDIPSGVCTTKLSHAHDEAVSCLSMNSDNSLVLSGSFNGVVRVHGLKSNAILRQFLGHHSCVTAALFYGDGGRILTASTDGNIKLWDARTADCLLTFSPPCPTTKNNALAMPINSIIFPPKSCSCFPSDSFFVCTKSSTVYLMNDMGQVLKVFSPPLGETCADFVCIAVSSRGNWIYCAAEDNSLHTFSSNTDASAPQECLAPLNIHDHDILGLACHPFEAALASISFDGNLHILQG